MSFIRMSTRVKGQRVPSRLYAWHDVEGGIHMIGRPPGGTGENGWIVVTWPELAFVVGNVMDRFTATRKKGESIYDWAARQASPKQKADFFRKYDKKAEAEHKKAMAAFDARRKAAAEKKRKEEVRAASKRAKNR